MGLSGWPDHLHQSPKVFQDQPRPFNSTFEFSCGPCIPAMALAAVSPSVFRCQCQQLVDLARTVQAAIQGLALVLAAKVWRSLKLGGRCFPGPGTR